MICTDSENNRPELALGDDRESVTFGVRIFGIGNVDKQPADRGFVICLGKKLATLPCVVIFVKNLSRGREFEIGSFMSGVALLEDDCK